MSKLSSWHCQNLESDFPDLFSDLPSRSVCPSVHLLNYLKHSHNFSQTCFSYSLNSLFSFCRTDRRIWSSGTGCPDRRDTPNADTEGLRYIDSWTWAGVGDGAQAFLSWKPHIYAKAKWTWCLCLAFICSPRISCEFFNCSLNGLQWMQRTVATPGFPVATCNLHCHGGSLSFDCCSYGASGHWKPSKGS